MWAVVWKIPHVTEIILKLKMLYCFAKKIYIRENCIGKQIQEFLVKIEQITINIFLSLFKWS